MSIDKKLRQKWICIILIIFMVLCCHSFVFIETSEADPSRSLSVEGKIRVSGAWALYPMMVKWAELFRKTYPNVRIDVSAGGAGKGVADALAGFVDIGMVSREIKPEEISRGAVYVPAVKDAVFVTVNKNNPVIKSLLEKGIKRKTLIDLWINGRGMTWGEITDTKSRDKVQVYTRSDACGAAETWAQYLGKKQEDLRGVGVYGDPGVAQAVNKDYLGIGFNNLNYAYDAKTGLPIQGLQVVPIDINENGKVDVQENLSTKRNAIRAIVKGVYPSPPARDLYLITKGGFKGPAKEFVRWILTDGQKYADEVGYIGLSRIQVKKALTQLAK